MNNNGYTLNISNEAFDKLREDFDNVLRATLLNMNKKDSKSAEMTIKLEIELTSLHTVTNEDGEEKMREYSKPSFSHKISSLMKTKLEAQGAFNGECELVYDEDIQDYVVKPVGAQQMNVFEQEIDTDCEYEDKTEDNAPLLLEEGTNENNEEGDIYASDFDEINEVKGKLKEMYGE